MAKYILIASPNNEEDARPGQTVYDLEEGEKGLKPGDTRLEGVDYAYVTLMADGSSPGFSVPYFKLEQIK